MVGTDRAHRVARERPTPMPARQGMNGSGGRFPRPNSTSRPVADRWRGVNHIDTLGRPVRAHLVRMRMPVVDVRVVRVLVREHLVPMRVHMGLVPAPGERVLMPVMLVMAMPVGMFERLVSVRMQVTFAHVEPDAQHHQGRRHPER